VAVERGNVVETVSVTGAISPLGKADLAFEKGGAVAAIYVKVGDPVTAGQALASLNAASDRANLAAAEATLKDLARGLRPEEEGAEAAKVTAAKVSLESARTDLLTAAQSAYTKTTDAIFNYTDDFFTNPRSGAPVLQLAADSYSIQNAIETSRHNLTNTFQLWALDLAGSDATALGAKSESYLSTARQFVNSLAALINRTSSASATTYLASANSALSLLDQAASSLTSARAALKAAESAYTAAAANYNLKAVGNSAEAVASQAARVAAAQAELAKDTVRSPLAGVVSRIDPEVGEFVSGGQTVFGVISNDAYKIEANVPEADIAKITLGNLASTTLDAYGSDVDFPARVTTIDPAQTILEGVPTYKVTLYFDQKDSRIRSGMTANLEILTREKNDVLYIPYRAIINEGGKKSVRLVKADGQTYETVPVTTGLKGSTGTIEIVSGLKVGDKVVTYLKP
jgi:HlyD family secretion protein